MWFLPIAAIAVVKLVADHLAEEERRTQQAIRQRALELARAREERLRASLRADLRARIRALDVAIADRHTPADVRRELLALRRDFASRLREET